LFTGLTGQKSDAAIVLTGFILTVTFTPLKNSLQGFVDRHFKEAPDPMKKLQVFDAQVQSVADVLDPQRLARRLVETAILAYEAQGGAIYLVRYGQWQLIHASENWQEDDRHISLPLAGEDGQPIGRIELGEQADGTTYNAQERRALRRTIERVVHVLQITDPGLATPAASGNRQPRPVPEAGAAAPAESSATPPPIGANGAG
jgi:hypothetical protein